MAARLLYEQEVYEIVGAAIEVHKELGPGFLESVYEEALALESATRGIAFQTQVKIDVYYKEQKLNKEFFADYIGFDKVLVELKAIKQITNIEYAQILNYLKATKMELGLLINFGSTGRLEWKRVIRTDRF